MLKGSTVDTGIKYSTYQFGKNNDHYLHVKRNSLEGNLLKFNFVAVKYPEFLIGTMDKYKETGLPLDRVRDTLISLILDEEVFPPGHLVQALRQKFKKLTS